MALKETDGKFNGLTGDLYHQIGSITGLNFGNNPHLHFREPVFSSEEFRRENPEQPLTIKMNDCALTKEEADQILAIAYGAYKRKKVLKETISHPAETDEGGNVTKEAWGEEVFEFPCESFEDC